MPHPPPHIGDIVDIWISFLEELGATTIGKAEYLGENLYRILKPDHYNPDNLVWEYVPDSIVRGYAMPNNPAPVRILELVRAPDWLYAGRDPETVKILKVWVPIADSEYESVWDTRAFDLGNGTCELMPTRDYDTEPMTWKFPPGSIVKFNHRHEAYELVSLPRGDEIYGRDPG